MGGVGIGCSRAADNRQRPPIDGRDFERGLRQQAPVTGAIDAEAVRRLRAKP
jgi:hypothetical protein